MYVRVLFYCFSIGFLFLKNDNKSLNKCTYVPQHVHWTTAVGTHINELPI